MADEKRIDATVNPNGEAANENATNPDQNKAKEPGKVKAFFEKHKGKVKTGLVVAGGIAAGVIADRLGIKLGGGKKKDEDRPAATEADV